MRALVAEHPVGARGQARQQPARAQKVDVRERAEEKQPFDAAGKAGQIEQEPASIVLGLDAMEIQNRIDPTLAKLRLPTNGRNIVDGRECALPLSLIGYVVVEQRQIELNVQGFFVGSLAGLAGLRIFKRAG